MKRKIFDLLEEKFFLPVLRSEDNSLQPRIGDAFSPVKPLVCPFKVFHLALVLIDFF